LSFKHPVGEKTENGILDAIFENDGRSMTPSQLHNFMKRKAFNDIRNDIRYASLSDKEKKEELAKRVPTLRTIKAGLKRLVEKERLENDNGHYTFHDRLKSDYRYFGRRFGRGALYLLTGLHWPGTCTLEENIKALVNVFGTYIVYCFTEASSLKPGEGEDAKNTIENTDKLITSWLEDVLDPHDMYATFLSIMKYQPTDKEVIRYRKTVGKKGWKLMRNMSYLPYPEDGVLKTRMLDENDSKYEIDERRVNRILEKIYELYPEYYEQLNNARERVQLELS
jgi:hypothetical protein